MAVKEVEIALEEESQKTYRVAYSTPAYLLVSHLQHKVGGKNPAEKYQRKVMALQILPKFSQSDFVTLARYELGIRYKNGGSAFDYWRESVLWNHQLLGGDLNASLQSKWAEMEGVLDKTQLFNLAKTPNDLINVDYVDVRLISPLERFLRELERETGRK